MNIGKIKALILVLFLATTASLSFSLNVYAQQAEGSAANATEYCDALGFPPESGAWFSCLNDTNEELESCELFNAGTEAWWDCRNDILELPTPVPEDPDPPATGSDESGVGDNGEAEFGPTGTLDPSDLNTDELDINDNPITARLIQIINFLSVGVGIVITISVAYAGIQYIMSRGDPNMTQKAIARLFQAGVALVLYIFGWAILNWLIPGGVLNDSGDPNARAPVIEQRVDIS